MIDGDTDLDLVAGDSVSNNIVLQDGASVDSFVALDLDDFVFLESGSNLSIVQVDGQLDGLIAQQLQIDDTSMLSITFDEVLAAEDELDFGLRLNGDVSAELESLIVAGRITFTGPDSVSIGVFRDEASFGNFTFLGYVGVSAVPEPGSAGLLAFLCVTALVRRRR